MKKVQIKTYKEIQTHEAKCDFCKQHKQECFTSSVTEKRHPIIFELLKVIDDYDFHIPLFGKSYKTIENYEYKSVWILDMDKEEEYEIQINICKDCIKQLAIKEKK